MKQIQWLWLGFGVVIVLLLEGFVLFGEPLPPLYAIPIALCLILGIGYETLLHGLWALWHLRWQSIQLLMLIAVTGAFWLGQYEEAAIVIVLYTLAEKLEDLGIAKSQSALAALLARMPKEVSVRGRDERIPVENLRLGDVVVLRPGEMIAVDGKVVAGDSFVDESTITGEPIAKDKGVGDLVFAGTLNKQGYLEMEVIRLIGDTTLAKIEEITKQATKEKAKTQKFIETFSQYYTPSILALALLWVTVPTLFFGQPFVENFFEALTLLVIACPCALVISTPISIYAAVGNASKKGALIKGGRYIEALGQMRAMAFDKTRTLTVGKPEVSAIIPYGSFSPDDLLGCAAGIEVFSEHPLAQSILEKAKEQQLDIHEAENFEAVVGKGIKADCCVCDERHHCLGKLSFILEEHIVPEEVIRDMDALHAKGNTVLALATHKEVEGLIALADTLRSDSRPLIAALHKQGILTAILTGDHPSSAQQVAKELGVERVYAEQLPEDKAETMRELINEYGVVGMVGDGVNDAPALALASVGITMQSLGSDTAIEAASVILLNDRLSLIPYLIQLGKRTLWTIRWNTAGAILVKLVFVGLALSGKANLAMAILADVGVTLLVIGNSLRLLRK